MPLSLLRIDDRLIHGQVVVGWVAALKADYIIVINDAAAKNEMQKCMLKLAVPPNLSVSIFSVEEFNLKNDSKEFSQHNVIILVTNPGDIVRIMEKGFKVNEVNLGGMRHALNKKEFTKCIFLDDNDINNFKKLQSLKVKVNVRMVPADKAQDLFECFLKGYCKIEED